MKRGILVTFEGIDGAGKSWQVERLSSTLSEAGIPHVTTCQPGGTPLAKELKKAVLAVRDEPVFIETELLIFAAARAQHMRHVILPALAEGNLVICDRFLDSVEAYEIGRGHDMGKVDTLYREFVNPDGLSPDVTFLLDLEPEIARERLCAGGSVCDRIEGDRDYQARVRSAYHRIAERDSSRIVRIDGTLPPETISEIVRKRLRL